MEGATWDVGNKYKRVAGEQPLSLSGLALHLVQIEKEKLESLKIKIKIRSGHTPDFCSSVCGLVHESATNQTAKMWLCYPKW